MKNCVPDQLPGTVPLAMRLEVEAARFRGREGVVGEKVRSGRVGEGVRGLGMVARG